MSSRTLRTARIYDPPRPEDGSRILVDRLWPRGVSKQAAALDDWCRDVAPSTDLRVWYGHDPAKYDEFVERYRGELTQPDAAAAFASLKQRCELGVVTLLTAVKEQDLSHVTVLVQLLSEPG
jgi:uncharacterized protein YeaO (DUF488 family)